MAILNLPSCLNLSKTRLEWGPSTSCNYTSTTTEFTKSRIARSWPVFTSTTPKRPCAQLLHKWMSILPSTSLKSLGVEQAQLDLVSPRRKSCSTSSTSRSSGLKSLARSVSIIPWDKLSSLWYQGALWMNSGTQFSCLERSIWKFWKMLRIQQRLYKSRSSWLSKPTLLQQWQRT